MTSKKSLHDEIVDVCVELLVVYFHVEELLQKKQQFALKDDDNGDFK